MELIERTDVLFQVERGADGGFYAVRARGPSFCFRGETMTEAARTAERALAFYTLRKQALGQG